MLEIGHQRMNPGGTPQLNTAFEIEQRAMIAPANAFEVVADDFRVPVKPQRNLRNDEIASVYGIGAVSQSVQQLIHRKRVGNLGDTEETVECGIVGKSVLGVEQEGA